MINLQITYDNEMDRETVKIITKEENTLIADLSKFLTEYKHDCLPLYKGTKLFVTPIKDIYLIRTDKNKLCAFTKGEEFSLNYRLYEIEELLLSFGFVKVNSGEIVNINKVTNFDLGEVGTIIINLDNSMVCRASRRRIKSIKKYLGV
ncbi:MAG: LytTR family DNA-binding domain-containing protein [Sphaerochaetaceae bacterium]